MLNFKIKLHPGSQIFEKVALNSLKIENIFVKITLQERPLECKFSEFKVTLQERPSEKVMLNFKIKLHPGSQILLQIRSKSKMLFFKITLQERPLEWNSKSPSRRGLQKDHFQLQNQVAYRQSDSQKSCFKFAQNRTYFCQNYPLGEASRI